MSGAPDDDLFPGLLARVPRLLARLPRNRLLWSYVIRGIDGSPYITRSIGPRIAGRRPILHRLHRPDADRHPHNHPWRRARFWILNGGYLEERVASHDRTILRLEERAALRGRTSLRWYLPGDANDFVADTYHRLVEVLPDTWTFGLVGERTDEEWGFLVDGAHVPHEDYFAQIGFRSEGLGV